jgi:fatty-acyl-CoA synthase
VFGVPDERYGEELCAWVIVHEAAALEEDELKSFCDGKIARHKVPRYVVFVAEFPMTVTGKIQKYKMREAATAQLGLHAASQITTA